MVGVAQLVRAPDCGSGGRGFETRHSPHFSQLRNLMIKGLVSPKSLWLHRFLQANHVSISSKCSIVSRRSIRLLAQFQHSLVS